MGIAVAVGVGGSIVGVVVDRSLVGLAVGE